MKRLVVVLCVAALMAVLSVPAFAVDVKVSGEYRVAGYLDKNRGLTDPAVATQGFYAQRLRVNTIFKVAEGLSLTTQFDALEKVWGQGRVGSVPGDTEDRSYATTNRLAENIEFTRAYVTFSALAGTWDVGYMGAGLTGTWFNDTEYSAGNIKYAYRTGPWSIVAAIQKDQDGNAAAIYGGSTVTQADKDRDEYKLTVAYKWATGDAGLSETFYNNEDNRKVSTDTSSYQQKYHRLNPWARVILGPLYVEGEVSYMFGDYASFDNPGGAGNVTRANSWAWYANAKYNLGPAYLGAQYAHVSGDDASTPDKYEGGYASGREYKPCLILFNSEYDQWAGNLGTNANNDIRENYVNKGSTNFNLYQIYAGFKPMPKLDLFASYSMAKLDQKSTTSAFTASTGAFTRFTYVDDNIGNEFDITATYKIYDNLSYMIGYGYLWAGDAWKGTSANNLISNDWLLMHKLTLTF